MEVDLKSPPITFIQKYYCKHSKIIESKATALGKLWKWMSVQSALKFYFHAFRVFSIFVIELFDDASWSWACLSESPLKLQLIEFHQSVQTLHSTSSESLDSVMEALNWLDVQCGVSRRKNEKKLERTCNKKSFAVRKTAKKNLSLWRRWFCSRVCGCVVDCEIICDRLWSRNLKISEKTHSVRGKLSGRENFFV